MRLNINLATQPYEDVKKFLARWGLLTVLLALVTAILVYLAVSNWRESRAVNSEIADLRQKMDALERDRAAAIETLNRPENKVIADQSRFLNQAIQRKSLSWTRIFMDLERIMPTGLHIVSITPELNKDNQLALRMVAAGNSREKAIELVRKMEESSTFKNAQLHSETMAPEGVQFEITSVYVPSSPEPPSKPDSKTAQTVAKSGGTR